MILTATINEVKRRILFDNPQAVVAVKGDYEVNGIAFAFPAIYEDDFDLSTAVKTVYYKATDGIIYNHVVTATDTDTGYPLWVFKDEINKGAYGDVEFALVCDKVEGGNIVKRWVSMITSFRVQKSIEIDESAQEDNEQTYSERLAYLMTQMATMQATVSGLASGAPTAVSLVSSMTDTNKLYVYTGSESGYTAGHWYYYNGSAWADGGQYGGTSVDTTLTVSGAAADAKVTGDKIAEIKEDLSGLKERLSTSDTVDFDNYIPSIRYISPSLNTWAQAEGVKAYMVPTNGASIVTIRANPSQVAIYACLTDSDNTLNTTPKYASGWSARAIVTANTSKEIELPDDCRYLWFMTANSSTNFKPDYVGLVHYFDADAITADINTLKSYHPDYSEKIVSILGDSISTFVPTADKVNGKAPAGCTTTYPGNVTQYQNSDVITVDNTWWGQVLKYYGMTLGINESYAGSTIGYNPNYTNNGKYTADNCLCSETRIGHLSENGTPDIIFVFGGTNDINHHMSGSNVRFAVGELDSAHNPYDFANFPMLTDTYYGAITTMLLRIQHSYPNAKILMILPYFCTYTHTSSGDIATPYDQNVWSNVAIDVCKYLGVDYLDLRTIINLYDVSTLLFDGLHPKANGMTAIANAVIHKLNDML